MLHLVGSPVLCFDPACCVIVLMAESSLSAFDGSGGGGGGEVVASAWRYQEWYDGVATAHAKLFGKSPEYYDNDPRINAMKKFLDTEIVVDRDNHGLSIMEHVKDVLGAEEPPNFLLKMCINSDLTEYAMTCYQKMQECGSMEAVMRPTAVYALFQSLNSSREFAQLGGEPLDKISELVCANDAEKHYVRYPWDMVERNASSGKLTYGLAMQIFYHERNLFVYNPKRWIPKVLEV